MNAYSITVFHCLYNYIHDFFVLQLTIMSTAELLSTLISQLTAGQRPQQLAEGAERTPSKQLQTSARNVIRDERKEKATPAQQMFGKGIYIRRCSQSLSNIWAGKCIQPSTACMHRIQDYLLFVLNMISPKVLFFRFFFFLHHAKCLIRNTSFILELQTHG